MSWTIKREFLAKREGKDLIKTMMYIVWKNTTDIFSRIAKSKKKSVHLYGDSEQVYSVKKFKHVRFEFYVHAGNPEVLFQGIYSDFRASRQFPGFVLFAF